MIVIPSMIEEQARRNQLFENVPKEVLIHGLSRSLFGESSWEKTDLDRIVGVELRENETTMCGIACMKYWNNRNVPTMLILILSWSLGGVCRQLIGTGVFISGFVNGGGLPMGFLPFLIFVIAALMSFSMGTSWGTFGMLIPIVTMIYEADGVGALLIPALGATLAGSVYGDHCSPISDTTILASTGADCKHIRHVETQLPYATLVAVVSAIGYLIAGFMGTPVVALLLETVILNRNDHVY